MPVPRCPLKFEVIFCVQGVISPLLANIYLHYALDQWVEAWRRKVAKGDVVIVRYADDFVMGFRSGRKQNDSWRSCGNGCGSSAWNYIRTRPG